MVSFRNRQYQAILLGMLVADAVSHGQLPWTWGRLGAAGEPDRSRPVPVAGAIADDRWCHQIATRLNHPGPPSEPLATTLQQLAAVDSVNGLLALLPQALLVLDQGEGMLNLADILPGPGHDAIGIIFYQSMIAILNADFAAVERMSQAVKAIAPTPQNRLAGVVALAFEQVLAAQWDFSLAVGQSLHTPAPIAGLPLLTGILSASRIGPGGIPLRDRLALAVPSAPLHQWLQQRWQGATANTVEQWVQGLWQQWLGCATAIAVAATPIAVQPANAVVRGDKLR